MSSYRVLVVDDSVVVRKLVSEALGEDPRIEVIGSAPNGKIGLDKVNQLKPDLITLDVEMPVMDGLEMLGLLRVEHPKLPVVMFSTLTERGATVTLEALEKGASDYVTKPTNMHSVAEAKQTIREQLVPKVLALCAQRPASAAPSAAPPVWAGRATPIDVVAIGSSTGGPDALTRVLSALPADFPVPILITQHMPPMFTAQFAERLNGKCALEVIEAGSGEAVTPGRVLIAPGDYHLTLSKLTGQVRTVLTQGPPENFCRPAVDVMFRSIADVYAGRALAIVLTGMGHDGAKGATLLKSLGAAVVAQDQASSVVWGMPGAVVEAGAAEEVLPLDLIVPTMVARAAVGRAVNTHAHRPAGALT